jgi:hypothetical protein
MQSVDVCVLFLAVAFELPVSPALSPLVQVNSENVRACCCAVGGCPVVVGCRQWHVVAVVCM